MLASTSGTPGDVKYLGTLQGDMSGAAETVQLVPQQVYSKRIGAQEGMGCWMFSRPSRYSAWSEATWDLVRNENFSPTPDRRSQLLGWGPGISPS